MQVERKDFTANFFNSAFIRIESTVKKDFDFDKRIYKVQILRLNFKLIAISFHY